MGINSDSVIKWAQSTGVMNVPEPFLDAVHGFPGCSGDTTTLTPVINPMNLVCPDRGPAKS